MSKHAELELPPQVVTGVHQVAVALERIVDMLEEIREKGLEPPAQAPVKRPGDPGFVEEQRKAVPRWPLCGSCGRSWPETVS